MRSQLGVASHRRLDPGVSFDLWAPRATEKPLARWRPRQGGAVDLMDERIGVGPLQTPVPTAGPGFQGALPLARPGLPLGKRPRIEAAPG
jgi:hypothetical protein